MNPAFEMCELQKVELIPPWKIPSSVEPFPTNLSRWSTIASLSRALEELQSILWKATLHKRSVGGLKSKQGFGEEMRAVCSVKCEEHTEFERSVCKSVHQSNTNAIPMAQKRCVSNVRLRSICTICKCIFVHTVHIMYYRLYTSVYSWGRTHKLSGNFRWWWIEHTDLMIGGEAWLSILESPCNSLLLLLRGSHGLSLSLSAKDKRQSQAGP